MTMTETEMGDEPDTILDVPITKAKRPIQVSTQRTPIHVYREVLRLGYKAFLNRGMTKITKEAYPDPDDLQAAAWLVAEQTLENLYAGKVRIVGGAKSDKVPREVMTEARRIAKALVKDELKRSGVKVSYVESSEITKAANALLADQPQIIEQAREEVERRAATKVKIDVAAIPLSQKRMKAAEAKKADKTLSASKAGKIATRARPNLGA